MKKIVLATLAALLIGGCGFIPTSAPPTSAVMLESPTAAPTMTDTALPTETSAPATETFTSTADVPTLEPTFTSAPPESLLAENLTTTPATATLVSVTNTATPVSFPSSVTPTPTNGVLTYGTLPPAVPFNTIALRNKSNAEAYISLQQQDGKGAILEYPVRGQVFVDIPLGSYIYVAWVGGKKMTGSFRVGSVSDTVVIFLYKDKVVVEKS